MIHSLPDFQHFFFFKCNFTFSYLWLCNCGEKQQKIPKVKTHSHWCPLMRPRRIHKSALHCWRERKDKHEAFDLPDVPPQPSYIQLNIIQYFIFLYTKPVIKPESETLKWRDTFVTTTDQKWLKWTDGFTNYKEKASALEGSSPWPPSFF